MSMPTASFGPDSPLGDPALDCLDRMRIARTIVAIATDAPADWSVRLAVYGQWGSGKTTVLNFAKALLLPTEHIVVSFNPWGQASPGAMWRNLVLTCYERLKESGVPVPGHLFKKARAFGQEVAAATEKAAGANELAAAVIGALAPALESRLSFDSDDLNWLPAALHGRRLVIFVDDIDRVDPNMVPVLLYAFKEVASVPGMSFVLALDPTVVAKALEGYHQGWGSGQAFLEKIIDYPIALPTSTDRGRWKIVARDRQAVCDCVPEEALRMTFQHFPTSPRSIRRLLRQLRILSEEARRYDESEFRWEIAILIELLRDMEPSLVENIFRSTEFISTFTTRRLFRFGPTIDEEYAETMRAIYQRARLDEGGIAAAEAIAASIAAMSGLMSPPSIQQHAFLLDAPSVLTRREFFRLAVEFRTDPARLPSLIAAHSDTIGRDKTDVAAAIFVRSVTELERSRNEATSSRRADEAAQHMDLADGYLDIAMNLVALGYAGGDFPALAPEHIKSAWKLILHNAGVNLFPGDRERRSSERDLGVSLLVTSSVNPSDLLTLTASLKYDLAPYRKTKGAKQLLALARQLAAEGWARHFVSSFGKAGFVVELWTNERHQERELLFDAAGPVWTQANWSRIEKTATTASDHPTIQENLIELFRLLVSRVSSTDWPSEDSAVRNLATKHRPKLRLLWKQATSASLQPLMEREISEFTAALQTLGVLRAKRSPGRKPAP